MKRIHSTLAGIMLAALSLQVNANERVGDFALIDHEGHFHHMAWYDDYDAVIILSQANRSAALPETLAEFQRLSDIYSEQNIVFFLLNPGKQSDRPAVAAEVAALGTSLPVLMDDTQLVAEKLGFTHIGQAIIYDPRRFSVLYRGPVEEHLEPALQTLLADNTVANASVPMSGEEIAFPVRDAHRQQAPSYETEIAPIIADNCASCHRANGIAPFALDSHQSAQGWSPMIREVVMTRRMPPGQIDNRVGHRIADAMNMADEDKQTLIHWIDAGSPIDGSRDPLAELTWPDTKWELGEPDLIVQIPPQTIPATGVVDYMNIQVDLGLTEDRWLRASEIVPGEPSVLHHIITTVVPPEGLPSQEEMLLSIINDMPEERAAPLRQQLFAAALGGDLNINALLDQLGEEADISALIFGSSDPDIASVTGYAPGVRPEVFPPDTGGILRVGTTLNLQMHYTTTGRETVDASEIGLYFYPEGEIPQRRMSAGVTNAFDIAIPPHAKDHEMSAEVTVPRDAYIYSLMPHMHFRGKRMKFTARYPDGSEELILSVPNYSFNWQISHQLEEPLLVPAGTRIVSTGAYDNSAQNRFNPDPDSEVNWGEQSWEEMFMGFYGWMYADQ